MYHSHPVLLLLLVAPGLLAAENVVEFARTPITGENILTRGSLSNSHLRFTKDKQGHVAFIGGSITEMQGYRPRVCSILVNQFPDTKFKFTAAGISSTCSTTGAFRLNRDVLSQGPVDLFFIEFAVNDDQDAGHARRECIRGLEGIIRQTRNHNPHADIVVTYFVNPSMLEMVKKGETPVAIAAHEEVAKHYEVSAIYLAKEVADQILAEQLSWQKFGGTHPKPYGNSLCATMIEKLLASSWNKSIDARRAHNLPKPIDPHSYSRGRFISIDEAELGDGWKIQIPDWGSLQGSCRGHFVKEKLLCAAYGAEPVNLEFSGTAVGAYVLAGPDAGIIEFTIDGKRPRVAALNTYHRFSKGLHYPRTVMFAADLADGQHTITLQPAAERDPSSVGTAIRILAFAAN